MSELKEKDLEVLHEAAVHVFKNACLWHPSDQLMAYTCWLSSREAYWRERPPRSWTGLEAAGGEVLDCAIDCLEYNLMIPRKVH